MSNYTVIKKAYENDIKYFSKASQDKFVTNLLKFKKDGCFVDIGGDSGNSQLFDRFLNWQGICISLINDNKALQEEAERCEKVIMEPAGHTNYANYYCKRKKTKYYNVDSTRFNYELLFKEDKIPSTIDYLSLSVGDSTNTTMKLIPFQDYTFSIITIGYSDVEQRKFLTDTGYHLLCSGVWFIDSESQNKCFEDWWINPKIFNIEEYKFLKCDKTNVDDIIEKFNK